MAGTLPEFSEEARSLQLGQYVHFKDIHHVYEVLGVARHSETLEEMVIYKSLWNGEGSIWARPLASFIGEVDTPEGRRPRFAKLEN